VNTSIVANMKSRAVTDGSKAEMLLQQQKSRVANGCSVRRVVQSVMMTISNVDGDEPRS